MEVDCRIRRDGEAVPRAVIWRDGRAWDITRVLHTSVSPDGEYEGTRYTVLIGNREKYLYQAGGRWYVRKAEGKGGTG